MVSRFPPTKLFFSAGGGGHKGEETGEDHKQICKSWTRK